MSARPVFTVRLRRDATVKRSAATWATITPQRPSGSSGKWRSATRASTGGA